jgi:carboxyl-terminal processing protease
MRFFDGQKWSDDVPIAVTAADEYDGTVLVDKRGHIYVCWTSNANGKNYDIFLNSFTNPFQQGTSINITNSNDDAMHARMACDEKNTVWATYYKWRKIRGYSRDKEVYLRRLENGRLSGELQISPRDVPQYEDHTEPAISVYDGGVVVAWSWDFHAASKPYSIQAGEPTVFVRQITNDMTLGKISSVSCKNIDVTPSVAVSGDGQIYCAWDSLRSNHRKNVCVSNVTLGRNNVPSEIRALNKPVTNVCTPSFAAGAKNNLVLLWSESEDNINWTLKSAEFDTQSKIWSAAKIVESAGNPRFCFAAFDLNNQLWLAYSAETENGREVKIKKLQKRPTESAGLNSSEKALYSNKNEEADTAIIDGALALKLQTKSDNNVSCKTVAKVDKDVVLKDEPKDIGVPKMNLSRVERLENFDILAEAIDKNFSFFIHKKINWPQITADYRQKIAAVGTDTEFYLLIYKFIRELKDFHSWLCNYKNVPKIGRFSPQMHTRLIEGKCVVTQIEQGSEASRKGLFAGCVIVGVDGLSVEKKLEKMEPLMRVYSSQRCFLEQAYRSILDGKANSYVSVKFITPDGSVKTAQLKRLSSTRDEEIIKPDFNITKGKFIWYGIHPSGYGYVRIVSFKGRMDIADEFDNALEKLKDTPGIIIDVRENPGGFGTSQERIIGRFITSRTKVNISYIKNGPGHEDFSMKESYFKPRGDWQYTKPIALLTNAITGSASDLFVCRMKSTGRPITVGTGTHGNSTGTCVYVLLPCNLVVRVSHGYICDVTGRIIEGNGTEPQIKVEHTIRDITNKTDPVIERAIKELKLKNKSGNSFNN